MRHRKKTVKLNRMTSHRKAMFTNLATSLITNRKIRTTFPKAKAVVPMIDKLITLGKDDTLHARRQVYRVLKDRTVVGILFNEIVPLVGSRNSGFTRIIRVGNRRGDGAPLAHLELITEEELPEKPKKTKKSKKREK